MNSPEPTQIILSCMRHGKSYLLTTFHQQFGVQTCFLFPSQAKSLHPGDLLAEFSVKDKDISAIVSPQRICFTTPLKLAILSCSLTYLSKLLPKAHPYPQIYQATEHTLLLLAKDHTVTDTNLVTLYCLFEKLLLSQLGYAFDTSQCTVSGTKNNLTYISPRTGHVVCKDVGTPFADKLFLIPGLWTGESRDFALALKITAHFIKMHLYERDELPFARNQIEKVAQKLDRENLKNEAHDFSELASSAGVVQVRELNAFYFDDAFENKKMPHQELL